MNLGEKIKKLRQFKGITQEQLANMLSISSQAVSKWETGVTNPDITLIPDIAKLFDVSTDELLGVEKSKKKSAKTDNDIISARLAKLEKMIGLLTASDDNEALEIMLEDSKKVYSSDFTQISDFEKSDWKINLAELINGNNRLVFRSTPVECVTGKYIDPKVVNESININITNVPTIYLTMHSDKPIDLVKIYFITKENPEWSENNSVRLRYSPDVHTIYVDMSIVGNWYGTLTGLRIDPIEDDGCHYQVANKSGIVELLQITLVDKNGNAVYDYNFGDKKQLNNSDWKVCDAEIVESNDSLKLNVFYVDRKITTYDPMLSNDNMDLDISHAKHVHIRLKTILDKNPNNHGWYSNNIYYDAYLQVYFKTENNNEYTQDKSVRVYYGTGSVMDIYADMSKNRLWNGTLTGLRIDPVEHLNGTFEIELIEILEADKMVGVGGKLCGIEKRLADIEDRQDDLEDMCSDLECRIDDLEEE